MGENILPGSLINSARGREYEGSSHVQTLLSKMALQRGRFDILLRHVRAGYMLNICPKFFGPKVWLVRHM